MSTATLLGMTAAAAMALSVAAGPVKAAPTQPVKNIVFVHGAFSDGSSWAKVITILQAKGYNVTAVGAGGHYEDAIHTDGFNVDNGRSSGR